METELKLCAMNTALEIVRNSAAITSENVIGVYKELLAVLNEQNNLSNFDKVMKGIMKVPKSK